MLGEQPRTRLVGQSCHGRVTIPIEFRRTLGIRDGETLEMRLEAGELRIRRLTTSGDTRADSNYRHDTSLPHSDLEQANRCEDAAHDCVRGCDS